MNSIKKQFRSFGYAFRGIYRSLATQVHLQFHALASCLVVLLAWYLGVSALEWCVLVLTIAAVWAAEIINTAIEHLTDLVSPNYHPLAERTKDAAAGAVLVLAIGAVVVAGIIFLPKIWLVI
jgi:diacylglycerol kinase (ATP)